MYKNKKTGAEKLFKTRYNTSRVATLATATKTIPTKATTATKTRTSTAMIIKNMKVATIREIAKAATAAAIATAIATAAVAKNQQN